MSSTQSGDPSTSSSSASPAPAQYFAATSGATPSPITSPYTSSPLASTPPALASSTPLSHSPSASRFSQPPQVRFSPRPLLSSNPSAERNRYLAKPSPENEYRETNPKTPLLPQPVSSASGRRNPRPVTTWTDNAALVLALVVLSVVFGVIVVENKTAKGDEGASYLVTARHGVVSSDVYECSEVGVDVMRDGGNAVDAVIATGACIGTVNMFASGIGGGGFLVTRLANGTSKTFNFRERAPAASHRDMYKDNYEAAKFGGLSIGVPGELHGLATAHQYYGVLPWHRLWEPSVEISIRGFPVTPVFEKIMAPHVDFFKAHRHEGWDFLFNKETGEIVKAGDTITRPEFARTLSTIAGRSVTDVSDYSGVHDFYNGDIAAQIVATVNSTGGIMTQADLASYFTSVESTVSTSFHGYTVETCAPPCSGQVLLEGLNIVEGLPVFESGEAVTYHYMVEAMKWLSAGRTELGDPTDPVVQSNEHRIKELVTKKWAEKVRKNISESTTYGWEHYRPSYEPNRVHGTSHIEAVDKEGNAASLTTTVNLYWGAQVADKVTGIIFNDQMDDFSTPNTPNSFLLRPSIYNYIVPGKRPLSSSAPAIVSKDGNVLFVVGASGGSRIVTGVFEVILKKLVFGYPLLTSIKSPRLHHQLLPDTVNVEVGVPGWIVDGLHRRGHKVLRKGKGEAGGSVVHGIWREGGVMWGCADWWRKGGRAAGF